MPPPRLTPRSRQKRSRHRRRRPVSSSGGKAGFRKERGMSGVRVLVGTHKGAFVMTSDAKRKQWDISGPHFTGWDIYHVKGSPVDPNRIYAAQNTGWFGQIIQRSDD